MYNKGHLLQLIKKKVLDTEPDATIILFGSYARGEEREDSDIDVLILVDSEKEKIRWPDSKHIFSAVNSVELETNKVIVPIIYTKNSWASHRVTPFYENVIREGKVL